jgi:hypothetical protein
MKAGLLNILIYFLIVVSSGQASYQINMTIGQPDLQIPDSSVGSWNAYYGLASPVQLDRDTAGFFCGLTVIGDGSEVLDMVAGTDLITVKDLNDINEANYIVLSRNFNRLILKLMSR